MRSGERKVACTPATEQSPLALLLLQLTLDHGLIAAIEEAHRLVRMIAQKAAPLILQLVAIGIGLVRLGHLKDIQKARVTQFVYKYLAVLRGRDIEDEGSVIKLQAGRATLPTLTWGN